MHFSRPTRQTLQKRHVVLALAVCMPISAVQAGWVGSSGGTYSAADNWNGAAIDDQFTAPGALPGSANPYIVNLDENRATLGDLNIVYSAGNTNFRLLTPSANPTTLTLNGNLTFNPGNTDGNIQLGSDNDRPLLIDLNGATRELVLKPGFRDKRQNSNFWGSVSNGNLTKLGEGELEWRTNTSGMAGGTLTLLQGKTSFFAESPGTSFAPSVISLGYAGGGKGGGVLILRVSGEPRAINNSTTVLNMNGGFIDSEGIEGANTLTAKALNLTGGRNAIINRRNNASTFNFTDFARVNHATLLLGGGDNNPTQVGAASGSALRILVTNSSEITSAASFIGTSTTAGTTNQKILPWAAATSKRDDGWTPKGGTSATGGFLTYDDTNGFRALNLSTEYAAFATAASDDNAIFTGGGTQTLSGNKTVNSLAFYNNPDGQPEPTLNLNGNTLTVGSGGLANLGKTDGGDRAAHFNGGTIAFGSNPAYLWGGNNGGSLDISSSISGSGGIVVASGHVTLNSSNSSSLSGDVVVQAEVNLNNSVLNGNTAIVLAGGSGINFQADKDNNNWGVCLVNANNIASNLSGVGRMRIGNSSQLNLVGAGGTMANITGATNRQVTVGNTAFISPGDPTGGVQEAGQIILSDGMEGVRFNSGAVLKLDLQSDTQFDKVSLWDETSDKTGFTFDPGSTIQISLLDGYAPTLGDSWQVFSVIDRQDSLFVSGAAVTGNSAAGLLIGAGDYEFALSSTGVLSVVAVPEPAVGGLLSAGLIGLLGRRSRNRASVRS